MSKSLRNNIRTATKAFSRLTPTKLADNPMMFLVWIASLIATSIFIRELYLDNPYILLYGQMTFWLWMTIYFSAFADTYAENMLPEDLTNHHQSLKTRLVCKIISKSDFSKFKLVPYNTIKSGNLIYLKSGDEVPFDGEVIAGRSYVYEADITGEIGDVGDVLKTPKGDNLLIAGSDLHGENDWLVMKVTFAKGKSFFARAMSRLKEIRRYSVPSELALKRIILGLSILFISVIFTVAVIANYSGVYIPTIYLIDLIVILLPTTISGLQKSIIIFAKARLAKNDIQVNDYVALDNAVDIQIALLDKTGTLTMGMREITDFIIVNEFYKESLHKYLLLSSIEDDTFEGKSIVSYAKKHLNDQDIIPPEDFKFHHFTSKQPISGCNFIGFEIRKGSISEIAKYLNIKVSEYPDEVKEIIENIASVHGTPVLFIINKNIVGVMHLRDRFRKGIMKQIEKLKKDGISIKMVTGDNELTASYISKKLGINSYYADCTPEKKLLLIRDLQSQGFNVAMCGDGVNDALALAQADIGLTFAKAGKVHKMLSANIISTKHDLYNLQILKNICKKMTIKRGALTVFSLSSDIAKYFVIVPALFTTAFPQLSILNFMNFHSLESVILASVMFNALIIVALTPFVFYDNNLARSKRGLWKNILLFGLGGIISPFIGIKCFDIFTSYIGLL